MFDPTLSWGKMPQVCVMVLCVGFLCWFCVLVLCRRVCSVCVFGLRVRFVCLGCVFELSVRCGTVFDPTLSWGRMPQVCVMVWDVGCVC